MVQNLVRSTDNSQPAQEIKTKGKYGNRINPNIAW